MSCPSLTHGSLAAPGTARQCSTQGTAWLRGGGVEGGVKAEFGYFAGFLMDYRGTEVRCVIFGDLERKQRHQVGTF